MKSQTTTCETSTLRAAPLLRCALLLALALAGSAACGGEASPEPAPNPAPAAKHEATRFGKTAAMWLAVIERALPHSVAPVVAGVALSQFGPEAGETIEAAVRRFGAGDGQTARAENRLAKHLGRVERLEWTRVAALGRALACDPEKMYPRALALIAEAVDEEAMEEDPDALLGVMLLKSLLELPGRRRFLSKGLAQGLLHPDPKVRGICRHMLSAIRETLNPFNAVPDPVLLNAGDARALLAGGDLYAQLFGAGALYRLGEDKMAVVPLLERAFKEGREHEALLAAGFVRDMGACAAPAADAFAAWLAHRKGDDSDKAAMSPILDALYALGPSAGKCMPLLKAIAADGAPILKAKALLALARVAPPGDAEFAALLEPEAPAKAGDTMVAARQLARVLAKNDAKALVACAMGLLAQNLDYDMEAEVVWVLAGAPEETRRAVAEQLESKDAKAREAALIAAQTLRAPEPELVAAVARRLLSRGVEAMRAQSALLAFGEAAAPALPAFKSALAKAHPVDALGLVRLMRYAGPAAVPELAELVGHTANEIDITALKTLREMETGAAGARGAVLKKLAASNDPAMSVACLATLAAMGPADEPTRAALTKAAQSPILQVRVAACDALRWTGGDPSPYWTPQVERP